MGFELWVSSLTGYRRKGTRFSSLKNLFIDNVTAKSIYEPLLCCPVTSDAEHAKSALKMREFDFAGVKEKKDGDVTGYIVAKELLNGDLKSYVKEIDSSLLISDSTPIADIFTVLNDRDFAFVIYGNKISGIVTKADINKPPVRIYLFGILSLFEMHLNFWVNHFYPDHIWTQEVPKKRFEKAEYIYELRKGNNQDLSLLECLQLCDKRNLLANSKQFLENFKFTSEFFESFVEGAEIIRNELAHSQTSIISNIEWTKFIEIVSKIEEFLKNSDDKTEQMASNGKNYKDIFI
jgi:hypothetical protein